MKNIICPISNEKVPEHLPRITAFYVISLFAAYIITGFIPIILFLAVDFFTRGFNFSKYSLLNFMARQTGSILQINSTPISKAPKLFAARLGGVMSILIIAFHLLSFSVSAVSVSVLVICLSTLECAIGFCVGCYLYSWIVLPVFVRK